MRIPSELDVSKFDHYLNAGIANSISHSLCKRGQTWWGANVLGPAVFSQLDQ